MGVDVFIVVENCFGEHWNLLVYCDSRLFILKVDVVLDFSHYFIFCPFNMVNLAAAVYYFRSLLTICLGILRLFDQWHRWINLKPNNHRYFMFWWQLLSGFWFRTVFSSSNNCRERVNSQWNISNIHRFLMMYRPNW